MRPGSNSWVGKTPWRGPGNPLQYSCLENPYGQRSLVDYSPWGRKESDTTKWLSTTALLSEGFPGGTSSKNSPANAGDIRDVGLILGSGRCPGERNSNPLQYSCLENPTDRGAWQAIVHRVAKSRTQLKWFNTLTWGFKKLWHNSERYSTCLHIQGCVEAYEIFDLA